MKILSLVLLAAAIGFVFLSFRRDRDDLQVNCLPDNVLVKHEPKPGETIIVEGPGGGGGFSGIHEFEPYSEVISIKPGEIGTIKYKLPIKK